MDKQDHHGTEGKIKMDDNNIQYYAKSKREDGTQELLRDHLAKVCKMAGVFGVK